MRGRKPKPTHLKVVTGNPGKRRLNESEPQPQLGADCPEHLSEKAREIWDRIAPELERINLLNLLSGEALAGYCDSYARWLEATEEIRKTGEVVKAPSGYPVQNPWRAIANKAFDQWTKLAADFGMTPSGMTRIGASNSKPKADPADEFFGKTAG